MIIGEIFDILVGELLGKLLGIFVDEAYPVFIGVVEDDDVFDEYVVEILGNNVSIFVGNILGILDGIFVGVVMDI